MSGFITWNDADDFAQFVNEDGGSRITEGKLFIPTESSVPTIDAVLTRVARWRFANDQKLSEDLGHNATVPEISNAGLTEMGLSSPTQNDFATIIGDGDLSFPHASNFMVISCWVRNIIAEYPNFGIIAAYHTGVGNAEIGYALIVDTDEQYKALVTVGGVTTKVAPSGGNVIADTDWHHLALFVGTTATGQLQFIVDANGTWSPSSTISQSISGSPQFTIGSSEFSGLSHFGFAGFIDELEVNTFTSLGPNNVIFNNKRFNTIIYLSPVFDTLEKGSVLSSILSKFETPNDSSVTFSFRASDTSFVQTSTSVNWTGFTSPNQVPSDFLAKISDMGVFVKGRFHQARIKLVPSTEHSGDSDPLQSQSPKLISLSINTSLAPVFTSASNAAFEPNAILGQIVSFSGTKEIHKVSLNLNITNPNRKLFFIGKSGTISFQAANFESSRDEWVFQPVLHWQGGWQTSGATIRNTLQSESYKDEDDAILNAPSLSYRLFANETGVYDMWGYGFVDGTGIFWSLNDDTTDLRQFTLGIEESGWTGVPRWTKFGSVFLEGGLHKFTIYLREINTTILDQWYFTINKNLKNDLDFLGDEGLSTPLPLSVGPFNTALRIRSLALGELDNLENPITGASIITAWLPSKRMSASGKFNYAIQDNVSSTGILFGNGVSLEYWQIGGGIENFAAWDFIFPTTSVGESFKSSDFGQNFIF